MNEETLKKQIATFEQQLEQIKAQGNYVAGKVDLAKQMLAEIQGAVAGPALKAVPPPPEEKSAAPTSV